MLTTWQNYKHFQKNILPPKSDWLWTNKIVWSFSTFPPLKQWEEISVYITSTRKPIHCSHKKRDHDIHVTWGSLEHPSQEDIPFVLIGRGGEEGNNSRGDPMLKLQWGTAEENGDGKKIASKGPFSSSKQKASNNLPVMAHLMPKSLQTFSQKGLFYPTSPL